MSNAKSVSRLAVPVRRGRRLLKIAVLLALGAFGAQAPAAVIYTYTGKPFEVASGGFTTADHLVFSFTLNQALAASQTSVIAPLSWELSVGAWSISSATPGAILGSSHVSSDALGMVDAACFSAFTSAGGFNLQAGDSPGEFLTLVTCSNPAAGPLESVVANNLGSGSSDLNTGSWTMAQVVDPDPDPDPNSVPAPGALALAALALLACGRRLKTQR